MFFVIAFLTEQAFMTAFAFAIGAIISIICGAVGMVIATQTNFRTTYCAREGLAPAFRVAFRAGCAMGFALVSIGLLGNSFLIQSSLFLFSFTNPSITLESSNPSSTWVTTTRSSSRPLPDMVLEDPSWPCLEEWVVVFTLKPLMWVLIW